jgi:hypothetical protein
MNKPMIRIHDLSTDEVIDREMTNEEYAQHLADIAEQELANKADLDKAKDKSALLQRLGLTEDELKTILS